MLSVTSRQAAEFITIDDRILCNSPLPILLHQSQQVFRLVAQDFLFSFLGVEIGVCVAWIGGAPASH